MSTRLERPYVPTSIDVYDADTGVPLGSTSRFIIHGRGQQWVAVYGAGNHVPGSPFNALQSAVDAIQAAYAGDPQPRKFKNDAVQEKPPVVIKTGVPEGMF